MDTHYVWNEDRTRLVEQDGEIDMSKPFFLEVKESAEWPAGRESAEWPADWEVLGYTED